jgi:hypothetical protein
MMASRPTKISFAEMREQGVRGLLIYCSDYRCNHSQATNGDPWPDDLRLSDVEPRLSRASSAARAASAARTCGRTPTGIGRRSG